MNDTPNDGGPAYPTEGYDHPNHGYVFGSPGMTLRDYFAAAALQGALACPTPAIQWVRLSEATGLTVDQIIAARSYELADAMIATRAQP